MQLNASFFLLGLVSIVGQVILLRELTVNFYGNEFFIGLALAAWLLWVAAGSGIARFGAISRAMEGHAAMALLQAAAVFLIFASIVAVRYANGAVGLQGEIPDLTFAAIMAVMMPAPLCLLLGLWWSSASTIAAAASPLPSIAVNRGYLVETIGFIVGGALFSTVLVILPSLVSASLLALIVFANMLLFIERRKWMRFPLLVGLGAALWSLHPAVMDLERWSTELRFGDQRILEAVNSRFGELIVTQTGGQRNFFESGLLLGSDRDEASAEEVVHIPMLEHPDPERVLLIGGGWSGALNEVLKHGTRDVYYLELDPTLIALADRYLPPLLKGGLVNQRVHLVYDDGYHYLKDPRSRFDVIIVNLPEPSTALINRFYTEEFFKLAASRLNEGGLLSTHLSFAPDRPTDSLARLNASVHNALSGAFSQVISLPEEENTLIAGNSGELTYDPAVLRKRYEARGLNNVFATENYITYRLTTDRIAQARELYGEFGDTSANRDMHPIAYFYQTLFWLDRFHPSLSRAFAFTAEHLWYIALAALAIATALLWRGSIASPGPVVSAAAAGFSLMAAEFSVIFVYQTIVGFLYYRLALLIAALMAGMALGVWVGNVVVRRRRAGRTALLIFHGLIILYCAALLIGVSSLRGLSIGAAEVALLLFAEMAGFFGAMIFPVANHIYLQENPLKRGKSSVIYSADLAGSAVGAALPSVALIPVFGLFRTMLFVGLVNLWAIGMLFLKDLRRKGV